MADFYPKMENAHDRTGVMRRQLFQVVDRDVRRCAAVAAPPASQSVVDRAEADWKGRLKDALAQAHLGVNFTRACEVCVELGVAFPSEIVEHRSLVADKLNLKVLERVRWLALAPMR